MPDTNDVVLNELLKKFYNDYQHVLSFIQKYEEPDSIPSMEPIVFLNLNRFNQIRERVNQVLKDYQQIQLPEGDSKESDTSKKNNTLYMLYRRCESELNEIETYLKEGYKIEGTKFPDFLDQSPSGTIVSEEQAAPGILDDYRQESWGIERICLDGMQNHLPEDSKGKNMYLQFLVDDVWVDYITAKRNRDKITKVRFADDGVGLSADNLKYLHSTKSKETESAGQFGEGLKLLSMAAVNYGLGLEIHSRNMIAEAYGELVNTINTRENDRVEKRYRLMYKINSYSGPPIKGTRTIFNLPPPEQDKEDYRQEFIDYALSLPEKMPALKEKKPEFESKEKGSIVKIVDTSFGGQVSVKGIYLKESPNFLFSYDFNTLEVTPNRDGFTSKFNPTREVCNFIANELTDKEIIKNIIRNVIEYYGDSNNKSIGPVEVYNLIPFLESTFANDINSNSLDRTNIWKEAIKEVCEEIEKNTGMKIAIEGLSSKILSEGVKEKLEDYIVIKSYEWEKILKYFGIKDVDEILPDFITHDYPIPIDINYGSEVCDDQRMILEFCQNHLPNDSGGKNTFLRFQTSDDKWHGHEEFSRFKDDEIKKIKISDNGLGYDYRFLTNIGTGKSSEQKSSGKWGEGSKIALAHSLRKGLKVLLHSRNWVGEVSAIEETRNKGYLNEKNVRTMQLTVKEDYTQDSSGAFSFLKKEHVLSDGDKGIIGENSSTTFIDPPLNIIKMFRNIKEYVLYFSDKKPIEKVGDRYILKQDGGKLYVRDIIIPGNHKLKYSYHLSSFDIKTRDRNSIDSKELENEISQIFSKTLNENVVRKFLIDAANYSEERSKNKDNEGIENYVEFNSQIGIKTKTRQANLWINTFKQLYGERVCIRKESDSDHNMVYMAQHIGYNVITLPNELAKNLSSIEGLNGEKIKDLRTVYDEITKNILEVDEKNISQEEREVLSKLYEYNDLLPKVIDPKRWMYNCDNKPLKKIKVFDYPEDYVGTKATGMCILRDDIDYIMISRDALKRGFKDFEIAAHTYWHEVAHFYTGASDPEKEFRDFLSTTLAKVASLYIKTKEYKDNRANNQEKIEGSKEIPSSNITDNKNLAASITTSEINRETKSFKEKMKSFKKRINNGLNKYFEGVRKSIEEEEDGREE